MIQSNIIKYSCEEDANLRKKNMKMNLKLNKNKWKPVMKFRLKQGIDGM